MYKKPLYVITGIAVFLLIFATTETFADTTTPSQITTEIGLGYESQSSPLVRISPEGALINLPGNQNMGAAYLKTNVQGYSSWGLGEGWGTALTGAATLKSAHNEQNFDFGSISIQPSLYMAIDDNTFGWGLTLERLSVTDQHFGDVIATQLNWTHSDPAGNFWALVGELAKNQHAEMFSELDSNSSSLILQHHLDKPLTNIDAFDFSIYLDRDQNKKGFDDLSYRTMMLSTSIQWHWLDVIWTASSTLQKTKFDDIAFELEPARTDKTIGLGLVAEHALSASNTLKVSYNYQHSFSTTAMFNNQYQQLEISICKTW